MPVQKNDSAFILSVKVTYSDTVQAVTFWTEQAVLGIPSHVGMKCNFTITPDEVQKSLTEFLIAECKKACDAITNPNPVSTRTISAIPSCQKFTFEGIEITLGGLSPLSTFVSEKEEFQVSGIHTQKIREEFCCIVA